jgi:hypothetical protein
LPIFFANFFGDEFAAVLSHHIPEQCTIPQESLSNLSPRDSIAIVFGNGLRAKETGKRFTPRM